MNDTGDGTGAWRPAQPADMPEGRMVEVSPGVRLHIVEAGPVDGPPVILLHGFPEFWFGWRRQIEALAAAGYRVLAPDQRGYGTSDKPAGIPAYRIDRLSGDVLGLADAAGLSTFALIGHDWGGAVAWWTALSAPGRVKRLVILNAPNPATMAAYARRHPTQALKSLYILSMQVPLLPEWSFRAGDFKMAGAALTGSSRPGTFLPADLDRYREAWSQPGALAGMVNWYRALRYRIDPPAGPVRPPTLILWGDRDAFLESGLAEAAAGTCEHARVVHVPEAGHWIQHEEPDLVNAEIIGFLAGSTA